MPNSLIDIVSLAHDDAQECLLAEFPGEVKLVSGELQYCAATPQRCRELSEYHCALVELYFKRRIRGH